MQLEKFNESLLKIYKLRQLHQFDFFQLVKINCTNEQYDMLLTTNINSMREVKFVIFWDPITMNPTLRFQIWDLGRCKLLSQLDCLETIIPKWFQVSMVIESGCHWFVVGNCDTSDIVCEDTDELQFLNKWIQMYILNWLKF